MDVWEEGLRWVADVCTSAGGDVVVAGDFNATVDHLAGLGTDGHLIGACDDAALEAGGAGSGTWPSDAPAWLASPIDHLLHGSSCTAEGFRVLDRDPGGTDHRPVVAVLGRQ
ncbi:endonuclease/exonuclease/phosphatase family protein [Microbacterium esteraromaticum]|uniref:endonuclease/exonuclease/phosphatase family protein n=1 Tax=Microbacterium esteraromaticum TaxID=57043 RepID=UPI003990C3E7